MLNEKEVLDFAGGRFLTPAISKYFDENMKDLKGEFYRGMLFPVHRIKKGEILEEWHQCGHWSLDINQAAKFAYDNYINDEYYEELCDEIGKENVKFVPVVFKTDEITGVELYKLLEQYDSDEIRAYGEEKEITTIGFDCVMTDDLKEEETTYGKVLLINVKPCVSK